MHYELIQLSNQAFDGGVWTAHAIKSMPELSDAPLGGAPDAALRVYLIVNFHQALR